MKNEKGHFQIIGCDNWFQILRTIGLVDFGLSTLSLLGTVIYAGIDDSDEARKTQVDILAPVTVGLIVKGTLFFIGPFTKEIFDRSKNSSNITEEDPLIKSPSNT